MLDMQSVFDRPTSKRFLGFHLGIQRVDRRYGTKLFRALLQWNWSQGLVDVRVS